MRGDSITTLRPSMALFSNALGVLTPATVSKGIWIFTNTEGAASPWQARYTHWNLAPTANWSP